MDIPPLIVNKYTGIRISTLVLITDALTVGLGLFTYGLEAVLIGFISVWGTSFGIDKMLTLGGGNAKAVQIISEAHAQINAAIQSELDRGTTLSDATGGYTGAPRKVILVVVEKKEYPMTAGAGQPDRRKRFWRSPAMRPTCMRGKGSRWNSRSRKALKAQA